MIKEKIKYTEKWLFLTSELWACEEGGSLGRRSEMFPCTVFNTIAVQLRIHSCCHRCWGGLPKEIDHSSPLWQEEWIYTLTSIDCVGVGAKLVGQLGFVYDDVVGSMGGLLDRQEGSYAGELGNLRCVWPLLVICCAASYDPKNKRRCQLIVWSWCQTYGAIVINCGAGRDHISKILWMRHHHRPLRRNCVAVGARSQQPGLPMNKQLKRCTDGCIFKFTSCFR